MWKWTFWRSTWRNWRFLARGKTRSRDDLLARRECRFKHVLDALSKLIEDLEANPCLYEPNQLRERIRALDRLDVVNLDMPPARTDPLRTALYGRASAIQARLEAANADIYEAIRAEVRLGRGRRALLPWVSRPHPMTSEGYDYLDEIIAGVLQFEDPGAVTFELTEEMVFYQPTPARHTFDLFERTGLTEQDLVVDLGSGLGHVPLLTCICTRARSIGVELEPAFVNSARQSAERLKLKRVQFLEQDARDVDLTEGTVFYLYTPFKGKMLATMLHALRGEASKRAIRICTYGPVAMAVADEDWLEAIGVPRVDRISVFRSRF